MEHLIKGGAELNPTDQKGDAPLDLARSEEVRGMLREGGAKRSKDL